MRPLFRLTVLSTVLFTAACAGPTTMSPSYSADELAKERAEQENMAKGAQTQGQAEGVEDIIENKDYYAQRMNAVAPRVTAGGQKVCAALGRSAAECTYTFTVENGKELNASADGKVIHVTTTMVRFADNDDALGYVLSHEYAHNMLGHVATTQQNAAIGGLAGMAADEFARRQGLNTGGKLSEYGQQFAVMRYSVGFEQEADYVGLYIARQAGLNIDNAAEMWRRMSARDSTGIYTRTTHPTNPERYIAMQKTVDEIHAKEAAGEPIIPNFRAK